MKTTNVQTSTSCQVFFGEFDLRVMDDDDSRSGRLARGRTCLNCDRSSPQTYLPIFAEKQIMILCRQCLLDLAGEAAPISPVNKLLAMSNLVDILSED